MVWNWHVFAANKIAHLLETADQYFKLNTPLNICFAHLYQYEDNIPFSNGITVLDVLVYEIYCVLN